MSTAALIQRVNAAGVSLQLVDGNIKARGTKAAVAGLIEPIRQHKADLVRWLEHAEEKESAIPVEVLQEEYRLFTRLAPPPSKTEPQPETEPPTDPQAWRELAVAYNEHHVNCTTCQAAGRGNRYGMRCGTGAALFTKYQSSI